VKSSRRSVGWHLDRSNTSKVLEGEAGLGSVSAHAVIEHRLPGYSREPNAQSENLACFADILRT
jgi:hypothetical protein